MRGPVRGPVNPEVTYIGVRGGAAPPPERVYIFGLPRKRVGACVTRTSGKRSRTWLPRASVRQGARPGRPNPGSARSCGFSRRVRDVCVVRIARAGPRPGGGKPPLSPPKCPIGVKMVEFHENYEFYVIFT